MAETSIRTHALGYLRAARVVVRVAEQRDGRRRPNYIRADVYGQTRYIVGYEPERGWGCSCQRPERPCRHIAAVQLVTGWEGPAWPHIALKKPGPAKAGA